MGQSSSDKQIGYLLRSYPRLSQTFILNEILALEKIGVLDSDLCHDQPPRKGCSNASRPDSGPCAIYGYRSIATPPGVW